MRSGVMMILKIAQQHAAQVSLAQDDDMIQAFTADRTDQSRDVVVLPWRSRGSDNLRDAVLAQNSIWRNRGQRQHRHASPPTRRSTHITMMQATDLREGNNVIARAG